MPNKLRDKTGIRYGRLVAAFYEVKKRLWLCKCDCGGEKLLRTGDIGKVKSCGCLLKEVLTKRNSKHGDAIRSNIAPEYSTWGGMIKRCHNPKSTTYAYYGGRGISVCNRWREGEDGLSGYECFLADMGRRPSSSHSIDRHPDNDGNYAPGNCRWALKMEQSVNRRGRRMVAFRGRSFPASEAARLAGLPPDILYDRLKCGWSVENALSTPVQPLFGGTGAARFSHTDQGKQIVALALHGMSGDDDAAEVILREARRK